MNKTQTVLTSLTTILLSTSSSIAQNHLSSFASGTANRVRNTVSNPLESAKRFSGATYSGVKGLASMPGKALSFGDSSLPDLSAGTQEFGLSGNVQFNEDVVYNIDLSYGYFFRDNWEVGFSADISGADTQISLGLDLFTEYNFDLNSKWVPYIGASVGLASLNSDSDTSSGLNSIEDVTSVKLGGEFGVKYFLRENIAITAAVNFEWSPDDVFGGLEEASAAASNINLGTRFYF